MKFINSFIMWEIGRVRKGLVSSGLAFILLFSSFVASDSFGEETRNVTSTLEGVVNYISGDPVADVVVVVYSSTLGYLNSTLTNQTGNFTLGLPSLPAGAGLILMIQKEDHFTRMTQLQVVGGPVDLGELLIVPLPAETEVVSGSVRNPVGIPVKDAQIKMRYEGPQGTFEYTDSTDSSGSFSMTVFPGTFELEVLVKGISVHNDTINIESGMGPYNFWIEVQTVPDRNSIIQGYITDGSKPLAGATIGIIDRSNELGAYVSANKTGFFNTTFWSGDHIILAMLTDYDAYVDSIMVPETGLVWMNITLKEDLYWFNGTVRDEEGSPIEGISVQFVKANSFGSFNSDISDSSGDFSIKVPEGEGYLMAVEDNPFDQETYDTYFQGPLDVTADINKLVTMKERPDFEGTTLVEFSTWEAFDITSSMKLSLNASKGVRILIDTMFGDSDLVVSGKESDMFLEMVMEDDSSLSEAPFSNDTSNNLTIAGNNFNIVNGSFSTDFLNISGEISVATEIELKQESSYTMNGTISPQITDLVMRLNLTYPEEDDDVMRIYMPVLEGWLYLNHSETNHDMKLNKGILEVVPTEDPDTGDDMDHEWITVNFASDAFIAGFEGNLEAIEGEEVHINVNVTDHVPGNNRSYQWNIGDNMTVNTSEPGIDHTFMENGTYDITVTMKDEIGRESSAFSTIVIINKDPELNVSVRNGTLENISEGDSITVDINATDVPGDPLHFQWALMGNWSDEIPFDESNSSFEVLIPDDGNITLAVRVEDDDGGYNLTELRFEAFNKAPTFEVEVEGLDEVDSVDQGVKVTLQVLNLSDVENDTVSFEWIHPVSGSIETNEDGPKLEIIFLDTGSYDISLRVIDEDGGEAWENITIDVTEDSEFDHDGDGLPRWWELLKGYDDDEPSDAQDDEDLDGLTTIQEYLNGTDPTLGDTDSDGMPDDFEIEYPGLKPLSDDSGDDLDGDGITNLDEYLNGTDPSVAEEEDDNDGDSSNSSLIFVIMVVTGIIIALGATVLMMTRKKQSSMWYEE
jgi:hypothetical protein